MMPAKFIDMMGNTVEVNYPPQRIISLVPSLTEFLYDLGLEDRVVGITKFCVHPDTWFRNKQRVGGTKNINHAIVNSLHPDLIIANKEENTQAIVEELSLKYPVWVSNIQTVEDALQMMFVIGELTDTRLIASEIVNDIKEGFKNFVPSHVSLRVLYLIWRNPWMCAGGDTFINDMITKVGWGNVVADKMRYPTLTLEEICTLQPDIVLLSSEPYPFKEKHILELQAILPHAKIILTDGEMWSWYGSRMRLAIPYLQALVNVVKIEK